MQICLPREYKRPPKELITGLLDGTIGHTGYHRGARSTLEFAGLGVAHHFVVIRSPF